MWVYEARAGVSSPTPYFYLIWGEKKIIILRSKNEIHKYLY